jgi:ABC-2 type transport system ATP-binding protein
VLDHGRTVAHGSPDELKQQIGNDRIDVKVPSVNELDHAARALEVFTSGSPSFDRDELIVTVPIVEGVSLMQVMRALDSAGVDALDLNRRQATLDDVFLTLTAPGGPGTEPSDAPPAGDAPDSPLIDEEVPA